ncbi:MAG: cyclophilin-like fold protein [bacterium]|nr:cyclophilin-like fold protein [bacterium]
MACLRHIMVESGSIGKVLVELTDENPETVEKFLKILPVEGRANLWGEEIYFKIPIDKIEPENPRQVVKEGEIAIWIENPSLCIFFGKTPVSTAKEIRAYSDVNVIGRVKGDYEIFKKVKSGEKIKVAIADQ